MKKKFLEVGQIVSTQGLKGEMRVDPWCDGPEFVCGFKKLYLENGQELLVTRSWVNKNVAVIKVKGIDSIEHADTMRRKVLYIDRDSVELDDNTFFFQDIIGCEVRDEKTDELYGAVTDILKTGANDVYQVTDKDGRDYLIPVIDDVVKNIDTENGIIKIFPMKGIFDDED